MAFFQTDNLWVSQLADGVATLVLDVQGRSVNVFNRQVLADLDAALDHVAAEPSFQLLLIRSGKQGNFIAGADLHEFAAVKTAADATALSEAGQRLFDKLAALRMPTVAIIAGACLGGGLEFALACDYRVVIDTPRTQFGLPEIELGLLPAWGGTQRLPRVVGVERALQMILGSRRLKTFEALAWGLADGLADEDQEPPQFLAQPVKRPKTSLPLRTWRQRLVESTAPGRWLLFRGAERVLRRRVPDDMPAPAEALQAIRVGLEKGLAAGLAYEREAIGRLAVSPACHNLVHLFFQREEVRKPALQPADNGQPSIRRIGVVGAGVMGAGIAQLASLKGYEVVIREVNETALAEGILRVLGLFNKAVERGVLPGSELAARLAAVHGTTAWKGFADVDLVIEAIVEDLEAKRTLFRELEQQVPATAILATNTSSLRVQHLQDGLKHPGRVAGLHFFNPVHKMPLVEVVRSPATRERVSAALLSWAAAVGKTPIAVKDSPGFLVNRILMPYLNEAVVLAGEGMRIELIDQAMRRFGMPVGPLELLDQVGLDVAAHIARAMEPTFGQRFAPSPAFAIMKDRGWLGQKAKRGFYLYRGGRKTRAHQAAQAVLREAAGAAAPHQLEVGAPREMMAAARERLVGLMINEAAACLGEHLAESATLIDLAMVLGTGWAPHRGGPLRYGADVGFGKVLHSLEQLVRSRGPRFEPCAELRRLAASSTTTTGPAG